MINIKSFQLLTLLAIVLGLSACEGYFGDVNIDPDNPSEVTPAVLLPSAQVRLAYTMGGDISRHTSIFTQHVDGAARQFDVYQNYGVQGVDVDAMWGGNIYSGILQDLKQLRRVAPESPHYTGIAQVLEAYTYMVTTDLFGDIPYSEALQDGVLQPAFDSQESVYNALESLIDESIANFAATDNGVVPGSDDLIYGGDITLWTKFAYTLKARLYLHLALQRGGNYAAALTALMNGFSASADDGRLQFGLSAPSSAPWFQYNNDRQDINIGANYVALLNNYNDPRVSILGEPLTENHPLFTPNQAQPLLTYTEAKFIEAECRMQTEGATQATYDAYLEAIESSFNELGYSNADYTTYVGQASVGTGAAALTLEDIMTQKYIALFTDPEVFNDWRRTGFPALTPNTGSQIPVRLPYSNEEILYNQNCPTNVTIFDRVWWDIN